MKSYAETINHTVMKAWGIFTYFLLKIPIVGGRCTSGARRKNCCGGVDVRVLPRFIYLVQTELRGRASGLVLGIDGKCADFPWLLIPRVFVLFYG